MEQEKTFTIRDKKRFLNQFYWLTKEQENLEEKLNKITLKINGLKATTFSDMPKGGPHQDIIDLLAVKEKYQNQLTKKMGKIENVRLEIESSIDTLEDYTYKEIAAEFSKSERHIRRLHDIAIRIMEIVKN